MFEFTATTTHYDNSIGSARLVAQFATKDEAEAVNATFPKSAGLKVTEVHCHKQANYFLVGGNYRLAGNGVTGTVNETATKRLRTALARAIKNDIAVEYSAKYANSYPTREAFETALNEALASA